MKFKKKKLVMELSKKDIDKLFNMGCIFEIKKGVWALLEERDNIFIELKGGVKNV